MRPQAEPQRLCTAVRHLLSAPRLCPWQWKASMGRARARRVDYVWFNTKESLENVCCLGVLMGPKITAPCPGRGSPSLPYGGLSPSLPYAWRFPPMTA